MVAEIFAKECDKYFERGVKKWKKEGIKEGRKEAIIKMLKIKIDRKIIKDIYGINDKELEKIEKEVI